VTDAAPDIDVVIPSWNARELLDACLASLERTRGELRLRVIVVDNASTDGSVEMVRQRHPWVETHVNGENEGFARACNRGAALGGAPLLLLLNSDAELRPGALQALQRLLAARSRAGVAGPRLVNPDGSFQSSHAPFPTLWQDFLVLTGIGRLLYGEHYPSHSAEEERGQQAVDWVGGACLLVRRSAWEEAGGLDVGYFMYAEEMDLCRRLGEMGWQVCYEPGATVMHVGGGSARRIAEQSEARLYGSRIRFYRRHLGEARAALLRAMILATTAVKIPVHALLRRVSGGRRGRRVVSLRRLRAELRRS